MLSNGHTCLLCCFHLHEFVLRLALSSHFFSFFHCLIQFHLFLKFLSDSVSTSTLSDTLLDVHMRKQAQKMLTFTRSWEKCCDRGSPGGNRCPDAGYLTQSVWSRKASWRRWPLSNNWRKSISLVRERRGKDFPGRGDGEPCWTQSLSILSALALLKNCLSLTWAPSTDSLLPLHLLHNSQGAFRRD